MPAKKISAALAAKAEAAAKEMGADELALATIDDQVATGLLEVETVVEQIGTGIECDAISEQVDAAPDFSQVDFGAALNAVAPAPAKEKLYRLDLKSARAYASDETVITREPVGKVVRWFAKSKIVGFELDPQGRVDEATGHPIVSSVTFNFAQAKERKIVPLCELVE